MTITVTINASSPAEFDEWVKRLRRLAPEGEVVDATWAPAEQPKVDIGEGEEDPSRYMNEQGKGSPDLQQKAEKPKRSRKKAVEPVAPAAPSEPETAPLPFAEPAGQAEKPAEPQPTSIEGVAVPTDHVEARALLMRVMSEVGPAASTQIVRDLGVAKLSDCTPDRYPEVARLVAEVLNTKKAA